MTKEKDILFLTLVAFALIILILVSIPLTRKPKEKIIPPKKAYLGRIAIVLDDWGYNLNNIPLLEQINLPLTVSVLPNLAYSKKISKDLSARGFEIILHLPMEPEGKNAMEKDTIKTSMQEKEIQEIILKSFASVENVKGVNNHMGSKATSSIKTVEIVFKELKKRNLFFLDSYVISTSKCLGVARRHGLRFAKRDIFIDNKNELEYIKKQIQLLKAEAKKNGYAIGIGHDRKNTIVALKEEMPKIEREGYRFVFVSELVK